MTGRQKAKRPTARDVAALANVSPQTVSRVVNNAENVRPETRSRVLEAMEQVGYTPNAAARSLRGGFSTTLGLVAHHIGRTGESHMVQAVTKTAQSFGYNLTLAAATDGSASALNSAIRQLQQSVAGIVVVGLEDSDASNLYVPPTLPVVVGDSRALPYPTVGFDQVGGAQLAVTHLLGLGHRTVHHVAGPAESRHTQNRIEGWRAALDAAGREIPPVAFGDWTPASGYEIGRDMAKDHDVTAIFAANDEMAAGVLRALHEEGRSVPLEISVVGFDDLVAEYLWPPLTSVKQDFERVGDHLVRLLISQIDGAPEFSIPTQVPAGLSIRSSSAPPA